MFVSLLPRDAAPRDKKQAQCCKKTTLLSISTDGSVGNNDPHASGGSTVHQRKRVHSPGKALTGFSLVVLGIAIASCYDAVPTAPAGRTTDRLRPRAHVAALPATSRSLPPAPGSKVFIATFPFIEEVVVESKITGTVQVTSDPLARFQVIGGKDYRGYAQNNTWGTQCDVSAYFTWGVSVNPARRALRDLEERGLTQFG